MTVALEIADSVPPNTSVNYDALPRYKQWELGYLSVNDLLPEELNAIRQEQLAAIGNRSIRLVEATV